MEKNCEGCARIGLLETEDVTLIDSVPVILDGVKKGTILLDPAYHLCPDCRDEYQRVWTEKYLRGEVQTAQRITKFWTTQ